MFVTNFVLHAIIESMELGAINVDVESVNEGVQAILSFKDKNFPEGIPIYNF